MTTALLEKEVENKEIINKGLSDICDDSSNESILPKTKSKLAYASLLFCSGCGEAAANSQAMTSGEIYTAGIGYGVLSMIGLYGLLSKGKGSLGGAIGSGVFGGVFGAIGATVYNLFTQQ